MQALPLKAGAVPAADFHLYLILQHTPAFVPEILSGTETSQTQSQLFDTKETCGEAKCCLFTKSYFL